MINAYEPLLDGGGEHPPICRDCQTSCWCTPHATPCEVGGCQCERCADVRIAMDEYEPERARELDDRPTDKLTVVANELDRERRGEVRDLVAERYGRPTRSRA